VSVGSGMAAWMDDELQWQQLRSVAICT